METNDIKKQMIQGFDAGMRSAEVWQALNINESYFYATLKKMIENGELVKCGRGQYRSPNHNGADAQARSDNKRALIERDRRRVSLPVFIQSRPAVILFIETSPIEIEAVARLEIEISGVWFAVPMRSHMRICIGHDIPRFSSTQETYNGVTCYRVTLVNGDQFDYPHDPKHPFTIDTKDK